MTNIYSNLKYTFIAYNSGYLHFWFKMKGFYMYLPLI